MALPRKQQVERPVLSPADVEKIANACKHERDRVLIRFLCYSGARIGESFAMRWESVDLERRTVTIRENVSSNTGLPIVRPTKTYAARTIVLPRAMAASLRVYREKTTDSCGLVFPDAKGGHLRYTNWRKVWDRATKEAGIKALPHDLRSTAASLLIDAGASVKDVQQHLGHSSVQITLDVYARVRPHRSDDLARRLDALRSDRKSDIRSLPYCKLPRPLVFRSDARRVGKPSCVGDPGHPLPIDGRRTGP
jgi:integrase